MLLSIIIPTKNRYSTLFSVVDMILSFDMNDNIEIIIQDNSNDNSEALDFITQRVNYDNLKYFYSSENLSVIENSDRAVINSSGEFVCFIGDDDGIMPNIVEVTRWMKENSYKALKSYKPNYYWPDQRADYFSNDVNGVLKLESFTEEFSIINCAKALDFTLSKGGTTIKMLPCLYHGIVERKTLDKIFHKTKTYFPGPSPDMANAVALAMVIDSYVYVNYPVIISGKSSKSTGGAGVLHKHVARIEDVNHLPRDTSENWDNRIPKYWTGPTIWAESLIKSLEHFNEINAISKFNFQYLYAYLKVFNFGDSTVIYRNFKYKRGLKYSITLGEVFLFRVSRFLKNRFFSSSIIEYKGVVDIKRAIKKIAEYRDNK